MSPLGIAKSMKTFNRCGYCLFDSGDFNANSIADIGLSLDWTSINSQAFNIIGPNKNVNFGAGPEGFG